jgi:hypothetical protein
VRCRSVYWIRVFTGGIEGLLVQPHSPAVVVKSFDLNESEHSVYEVATGVDECRAAAAHKLADPKKAPDPVSILRIGEEDLIRFGIALSRDEFGVTGVPHWDARHRNLLASGDALQALVRFLVEQYVEGHNFLRRIDKFFINKCLDSLQSPDSCCPEHVRKIGLWCQKKTAERPSFNSDEIKDELSHLTFDDSTIRPIAAQINSGDRLSDWYQAIDQLRAKYTTHYLAALQGRSLIRR